VDERARELHTQAKRHVNPQTRAILQSPNSTSPPRTLATAEESSAPRRLMAEDEARKSMENTGMGIRQGAAHQGAANTVPITRRAAAEAARSDAPRQGPSNPCQAMNSMPGNEFASWF
jgi:hypothetical protein